MAIKLQMTGIVELLSLSFKISILIMLCVLSCFSMASFMSFENVIMVLLMSLLSMASVISYVSFKHMQNLEEFIEAAEDYIDTAATKLTYIESRMDAAEGRMSDVVRHLAEAFDNFRLTIGPQSWLENKVSSQFETFVGSQYKKFGRFEMTT